MAEPLIPFRSQQRVNLPHVGRASGESKFKARLADAMHPGGDQHFSTAPGERRYIVADDESLYGSMSDQGLETCG